MLQISATDVSAVGLKNGIRKEQGFTDFSIIWKPPQNSRCRENGKKEVSY